MRSERALRTKPTTRNALAFALVTGLALGACTEGETRNAPEDTAPVEEAAPEATVRTILPGVSMRFTADRAVSTDTDEIGSTFTASLVSPVSDEAGQEIIPAGAPSRWIVTESSTEDGRSVLAFRLASIQIEGEWVEAPATITGATLDTDHPDSDGETAAKIGIGTAAGALVGQIIGKDTEGTLVGAGVGAAVGTAVALSTRGGHATLPAGSTLEVELDEPIRIH